MYGNVRPISVSYLTQDKKKELKLKRKKKKKKPLLPYTEFNHVCAVLRTSRFFGKFNKVNLLAAATTRVTLSRFLPHALSIYI